MHKKFLIISLIVIILALVVEQNNSYAGKGTYSSNDTYMLAKMINGEARGERCIGIYAAGADI